MQPRKIELLAPAKDGSVGMAAIDHGADAVYIGGPKFGARTAACNSIDEIRKLIDHAHQFHARVYVALNTLLTDDEIGEAVDIIHKLHEIGADAVIIQDLGLLECDLPPIPLHASTQTDNRCAEKVKFLEDVGFSQVVLARELSLTEIKRIRAATSVPLEFFVHGALCVSYSGRCNFSEKVAHRSANRGRCAQFCRHSYTLKDGNGKILKENSHLLSLQDLDLSAHLEKLLLAGISSLKIEGRLKDMDYVKNVTAFYRRALDKIICRDDTLANSSSGRCTYSFTPDPERTFHRGGGSYFLYGRKKIGAISTPKSTGKKIGHVKRSNADLFEIDTKETITNGDGLCFFDAENRLVGFRVNTVQGSKIFPKDRIVIPRGTILFRNFDTAFHRALQNSHDCRKIQVSVILSETADGLEVVVIDEDGITSSQSFPLAEERARDRELMQRSLARQMAKSGKTIFSVGKVTLEMTDIPYLPLSAINDIRRTAFAHHLQVRLEKHPIARKRRTRKTETWPVHLPLPLDHILNQKAAVFYAHHGMPSSFQAEQRSADAAVLMTCRYCIRAELELCPKINRDAPTPAGPLTISDNTGTYELAFDCDRCEMQVLLRTDDKKST